MADLDPERLIKARRAYVDSQRIGGAGEIEFLAAAIQAYLDSALDGDVALNEHHITASAKMGDRDLVARVNRMRENSPTPGRSGNSDEEKPGEGEPLPDQLADD